MRTNNSKVKNVIISIYFIFIVLAILLTTLMSSFNLVSENPIVNILFILIIIGVLFIITYKISKYFEYDSDGVKVVIKNKGLLVSDYVNYREHRVEFLKSELINFKFKNYFFYKSLILILKSLNGGVRKEVFNVTLVSRKKRRYIRQSLRKMVKLNEKERNRK